MKRYDLVWDRDKYDGAAMEEAEQGEWIKWQDAYNLEESIVMFLNDIEKKVNRILRYLKPIEED